MSPDVGARGTRVLLALLRVSARGERATVRAVAAEARLASFGKAHRELVRLRELGLVTWDEGRTGTLRPTVAVVVPRRAA